MAISAVQYLKIPKFESEVVYEAKTDKVSALLVDKNEYPSMTKAIVSKGVEIMPYNPTDLVRKVMPKISTRNVHYADILIGVCHIRV